MSWWKKFTNVFSKDKSVPKIEVDEVTYVKSKEKILEEEVEKATLSLRRFDDAVDRRVVKTSPKLEVPKEPVTPPKRARDKGRFVADDKSTPHMNEAWVEGKAPAKKKATKKPKSKSKSPKKEKPKYRRTKNKRKR
ncbi:MAG: hypothetical protein CMM00_04760 [Rhodopirellula sp.]|nr:hypothetical protein [Rhodopirellula sp.]